VRHLAVLTRPTLPYTEIATRIEGFVNASGFQFQSSLFQLQEVNTVPSLDRTVNYECYPDMSLAKHDTKKEDSHVQIPNIKVRKIGNVFII
jgi:hypothetical protein